MEPFYQDHAVTIYCARLEDVADELIDTFDAIVTDPPYGETSAEWDRWPKLWPSLLWKIAPENCSMWCWGSFGMFMRQWQEFSHWKYAQEVIWEKPNGAGPVKDRFNRVHELAVQFYKGKWSSLPHEILRVPKTHDLDKSAKPSPRDPSLHVEHRNLYKGKPDYIDDGLRVCRSVIKASVPRGNKRAHPSQKPTDVLQFLIHESTSSGQTVLDPFAGSGSTAVAALALGRNVILVESREDYCEPAVARLQAVQVKL